MKAPSPPDEPLRLATLREYRVLDTAREQAFDDITLLAAQICDMPLATISLVDENRQWLKSRVGIDVQETPRDVAFCAHTISHREGIMVVNDATADPRFADSPLVTSDPHIVFYAGAPLIAPNGTAVGALCVMDRNPRTLGPRQLEALAALGRNVVAQLELRRQARELAAEVVERKCAEAKLRDQYDRLAIGERESTRLLELAKKSRAGLLSVLEDEKRAGQHLRESEERFRQLAEYIREVFWILDVAKDLIIFASSAYEEIWGGSRESLYASPLTWMEAIHPDDRGRIDAAWGCKRMSGTFDEEYRIIRPDGATRWIRDRAFPVRDDFGKIYRLVGVAEDITARKEIEAQFFRAQRIDAIGTLASGIAHDMNNILAPIMMSAPLLRLGLSREQTEKTLTTIETSAQRGAELVRQLLTFGRGVEGARGVVDPGDVVRDVVRMAQQTFPRNISVIGDVPASIWAVIGDITQLHQVVLNLCVNARDAMPQGGRLSIAVEDIRFDRSMASAVREAKAGPYVLISVTDTGTGIPPDVIERIFDPFFTTKEVGKGTGLGLSTVTGLVKGHGGFIKLLSEVAKGSTFQVYLPAVPEMKAEDDPEAVAITPSGNGELLLVVDDEEEVREVSRDLLVEFGYRVMTAADGNEAAELFAQNAGEIRAVITDIDMPLMDGLTLIRKLKKLNPNISVLVSSGIASKPEMDRRNAELGVLGVGPILSKPYRAKKLLGAVRDLLAPEDAEIVAP